MKLECSQSGFGAQPTEGALEAALRDASCGPPRGVAAVFKAEIQNKQQLSSVLVPQLAKDACDAKEQRAFAGRSCGPLRFLAGTANS